MPTRSLLSLALALPAGLLAQTPPGAGELLRETAPRRPATPPASPPVLSPAAPAEDAAADSTPIPVKTIRVVGHTALPEAELRALVAPTEGTSPTLTELRALTDRITQAYQRRGYALARAYLPAQEIQDGALTIAIQEGRLGASRVDNTSRVATPVLQNFLAPLPPGQPVSLPVLEDALLRLREIPGQTSTATLQPGAEPGTTDLVVASTPAKILSGRLTLDNFGGDPTGEYRLGLDATVASPLSRGDQLTVQGLGSLETDHGLRYGRAAYDHPLGGRGLRLGTAYSRLAYELGQNFQALDAHGSADTFQLWASHPLHRSRTATLDARLGYDFRDINDRIDVGSVRTPRHLHSVSLGLDGTRGDGLLGGGLTSLSVAFTHTDVSIRDEAARIQDEATARTAGDSGKLELQAARVQNLPGAFTLHLRASGQASDGNLDSADQIGAAGPNAVRAYPQGEAYGDQAVHLSAELRHPLPLPAALGDWQGVLFHDHATLWEARDPWTTDDNRRSLAGSGAGLRWAHGEAWSARADMAWRTLGGSPQTDGSHHPQVWASLSYGF